MNFNLSDKEKTFEELLYMHKTMKQEVKKDATNVFVVDVKAPIAMVKGTSKTKAKSKFKAQK